MNPLKFESRSQGTETTTALLEIYWRTIPRNEEEADAEVEQVWNVDKDCEISYSALSLEESAEIEEKIFKLAQENAYDAWYDHMICKAERDADAAEDR